ncbi:MAG: glutathione S-transferase family protein [Betaproteobacteria bacterium]|nr:MAG: glutathione S-transferase family protein [Betaproteobacteria bacterium]
MKPLRLAIGNKNYSSWSMRPWVLLTQAGIAFEEIQLKFSDEGKVNGIEPYSPTRQVPVLIVEGEPVWDSLAICEAVAEMDPGKNLWPADARARQVARSVCAEMHAGFRSLRDDMPMNIRASLPGKGMSPEVRKDIDRIVAIWESCRTRYGQGGELLFGHFTAADAFYAPVATRFLTYAVKLPPLAQRYADALLALSAVRAWVAQARRETEVVRADEPYA